MRGGEPGESVVVTIPVRRVTELRSLGRTQLTTVNLIDTPVSLRLMTERRNIRFGE
jgi:hypothetical protein